MKNFIHNITKKYGEDFYVFGEFWNGDTETNDEYLESIDYLYDLDRRGPPPKSLQS